MGPALKALNVPVADRVRQIELALERERGCPRCAGTARLRQRAAFPALGLRPCPPDEPLRMNVVVGKRWAETPIFIDRWIPDLPALLEPAPEHHAQRDRAQGPPRPSYLARQNMEIVASGARTRRRIRPTPENLDRVLSGKLFVRQRPGPEERPRHREVHLPELREHLHARDARAVLFARARRDFSHGCIRLEDPAALAQWVLRDDPAWTQERSTRRWPATRRPRST